MCLQLECIRLYLMTRFQANREMIIKVESELCPKLRNRLYKEKLACSKWLACWAGRTKFEVKNGLGWRVSLWTWKRRSATVGSGT